MLELPYLRLLPPQKIERKFGVEYGVPERILVLLGLSLGYPFTILLPIFSVAL